MITLNLLKRNKVQRLSRKAKRKLNLGKDLTSTQSNIAQIDDYFFYVNTHNTDNHTIRVSYLRDNKLITELTSELLMLYYNNSKKYLTLLEFVNEIKLRLN